VETRRPVRPGESAPEFTLPAVMQPGEVSLADYRDRSAVLLAVFRGLHCPFCRRQIFQLSGIQEALAGLGIVTLAVVNTPRERAELYFRYHPTRVLLLADPEALTHRLFGVPSVVPDQAFAAVRINPTGELPAPVHPLEANTVLNTKDGFVLTPVDEAVFAAHGTQLAGHFLIDRGGIVRWTSIEGDKGVHTIAAFPGPAEILAAARTLESPRAR
jgi:peroxiredoxin